MSDRKIIFSEDKDYRYSFYQQWGEGASIMFVGLNPSLSDGLNPTLNKCIGFSKRWGYGSCYVLNLFAYRAPTPSILRKIPNPIGPENDKWLLETVDKVDKVIFAWGTHGNLLNRDREVIILLKTAYCLELTKGEFPKHPLYIRSDSQPVPFRPVNNLSPYDKNS
jgi:hypothetical protein